MAVIGRRPTASGPVGAFGRYRAPDGSRGGPVGLDLDRPHVVLVVGKRGSGKSYTLGVIAEALARTAGVAPTVVDPMGAFRTLTRPADGEAVPATVVDPRLPASALSPPDWCQLLGLEPTDPAGTLVWQAASERDTLARMAGFVADADVRAATRRAAANHLRLADAWGVFASSVESSGEDTACDGVATESVLVGDVTVLDLAGRPADARDAVVAGVAGRLYRARTVDPASRLPWLLVDEAHAFFEGVARRELDRLLTRGRQPGVSLVMATQRPSALPEVAVSQADVVAAHQLSSQADRESLVTARPGYLGDAVAAGLPTAPGAALVADDATETVHRVQVRERDTPHGGASPRAAAVAGTARSEGPSRAESDE